HRGAPAVLRLDQPAQHRPWQGAQCRDPCRAHALRRSRDPGCAALGAVPVEAARGCPGTAYGPGLLRGAAAGNLGQPGTGRAGGGRAPCPRGRRPDPGGDAMNPSSATLPCAGALLLALAALPALAQEPLGTGPDPYACTSITIDAERLRCYDDALG